MNEYQRQRRDEYEIERMVNESRRHLEEPWYVQDPPEEKPKPPRPEGCKLYQERHGAYLWRVQHGTRMYWAIANFEGVIQGAAYRNKGDALAALDSIPPPPEPDLPF